MTGFYLRAQASNGCVLFDEVAIEEGFSMPAQFSVRDTLIQSAQFLSGNAEVTSLGGATMPKLPDDETALVNIVICAAK